MIEPADILDKAVPLTKVIQGVGLTREDSGLFILREGEDFLWSQSNREDRLAHDG